MARMTIAQLREREVLRLAAYHVNGGNDPKTYDFDADNYNNEDVATAKRLMNSFYRLCALAERNLYLANNERTCNSPYTKESEERESRWYTRLNKEFKEFAGLELFYCGYMPSIGVIYRPSVCCICSWRVVRTEKRAQSKNQLF